MDHSTRSRFWLWLVIISLALLKPEASAELIFQDGFANVGGGNVAGNSVTSSVPFLDVEGNGWQVQSPTTPLYLDGQGHLFDASVNGGTASVALTPIGPHGRMAATTTLQLPTGSANWIGMGFENDKKSLTQSDSLSGPWVRANNDGSIIFYGGTNTNNPIFFSNAFTNVGTPVTVSLVYDAFHGSASLSVIAGNFTNQLLNGAPVTNSTGTIYASHLAFQFSAVGTVLSNRWAGPVTVDWIPRPPPLLTLPVPTNSIITYPVGSPTGGDDTAEIQGILSLAADTGQPVQVQFTAGATYHITNSSLIAAIPLVLSDATNLPHQQRQLQNDCPKSRIGSLPLRSCSNGQSLKASPWTMIRCLLRRAW